ncbi:hypothetical protein Sp245p_03650 [Azospirillum baldaniorum]|uniref:Uncharacterized protein n=1 Tax=Azospirillum baldaniorum TaxID=1064539 RepID=A0A9P1NNI5_9PROT|nr:hypothetical protein [Azospirillum baldaniorum]TWA73337.1 hypothetical protein FBZ85_11629 [Azospirillum brasilense]AWJ88948.1 hypothetical protein Sp245p_03650 [Azospirillum baldaniorum]NUB05144.1 hypothetical protein [Azospirillum baldaniorum]TWA62454.1 hypothetical protein FBZ84_111232 [Azospirillum baldaniorum]CCC99336.1 protein of unknown function [Azospirillum baldaniorum]
MNAIAMNVVKERHPVEHALDSRIHGVIVSSVDSAPLTASVEPSSTPVPLKPSAAMLAAGSRAGGVSVETAWKIYLAMIKEAA